MDMPNPTRRRLALSIAALAAPPALAQSAQPAYPTRPIRLIAPFAVGGAADTVARVLAPKLGEALKQPVVVENRAGAGGALGSGAVAAAAPDGYTLLLNLFPPHQTVHLVSKGVSYDPVKDFTAIALIASAPQALVVPAGSPLKTMQDYLAAARGDKELNYGTSGIGTSQHLAGLMLASSQKINLSHIAYRSGSAAFTDLAGGQIDSAIVVLSNVLPHIRSGKLRALGVLENRRARSAPEIPTLAEGGVRGFSLPETLVGVLGPARLPAAIVARLHDEIAKVARDPEVVAQLEKAGYEPRSASAAEFGRHLADSEKLYRQIVTAAGITPE